MVRGVLLVWVLLSGSLCGCAVSVGGSGAQADASMRDAAAVVDTPAPLDVAAVVDAPNGLPPRERWRAVRYRTEISGQVVEFTDTLPQSAPEGTMRVNGVMVVDGQRLMIHVGLIERSGLSVLDAGAAFWRPQALQVDGRRVARSDGFTFEYTAASQPVEVRFDTLEDGRLWTVVQEPSPRLRSFAIAFERDPTPARRDRIEVSAAIHWRAADPATGVVSPVLLWDVAGPTWLEQRMPDVTLMGAGSWRRAAMDLSAQTPPAAMYQGRVGGVPVAVMIPSAYVDLDGDNRYTAADGRRMRSDAAIVWRGEGPDEALRGTPFEFLLPGFSVASIPYENATSPGAPRPLLPYDNANLVSPVIESDLADSPGSPRVELPDFVP